MKTLLAVTMILVFQFGLIDEGFASSLNLDIKIFIESFYIGNNKMRSTLYDLGLSTDPTAVDTIMVELHDTVPPYIVAYTSESILHNTGFANFSFPSSTLDRWFYIAVRHRNTIQTWSKDPLFFYSTKMEFDFTTPFHEFETLSDSAMAILDTLSIDTVLQFSDITFDDGSNVADFLMQHPLNNNVKHVINNNLSASDQKKQLIGYMTQKAFELKSSQFFPGNGSNQPEQTKIGYSFGSHQYIQPDFPKSGDCTTQSIHGVDCIGFILLLSQAAHLPLDLKGQGAVYWNDTSVWNKALRNSSDYFNLRAKKIIHPTFNSLKYGDLIIWPGSHVGMVLKENPFRLFSSTGYPNDCRILNNTPPSVCGHCAKNLDSKHGPVLHPNWTQGLLNAWNNGNYNVIRIEEKSCPDAVSDFDGNVYNTVGIGGQCWTKENLNSSHYRNGDPIPTGLSDASWYATTSGAYASPHGNVANESVYGKLYNFYTVDDPRQLCPSGWHVPTDSEWTILSTSLGGGAIAGGAMKETGTAHWFSPNTDATNSSGFAGLPGGGRHYDGSFSYIGYYGVLWSSTEANTTYAWTHDLYNSLGDFVRNYYNKHYGFSVRCLRD